MGETLLGKPYGLTPDELLKAHQVLTASTAIKKTPYMLDLETMDRKPDIVPKVGDKVKIKSRAWLDKWKVKHGDGMLVPLEGFCFCGFGKMLTLCGKTLTVTETTPEYFRLDDGEGYYWTLEMFEEVYPMLNQINSPFPKIDFNSKADFFEKPLTVPPFSVNGGELIVAKTAIGSMIEDTAKRLAAYTSVQGLTAKRKLKQVKTTRLIKLKKL